MSDSEVTIDVPTPDEVERLVELFVADMRDLGIKPSRDDMRAITRQMFDDDRQHLRTARADGRIVGVLLASEFASIKFAGRALWIEELYVTPEYRRAGIGRLLVDDFLYWAHQNGFVGVDLEAYRMNTAASVLYRSIGFRRLARERYSFDMAEYELLEDNDD